MTHPADLHVGNRVRQRRWMSGLTQRQLGDRVGINYQQVQKYETGAIRIGASLLWKIAAVMEARMSEGS